MTALIGCHCEERSDKAISAGLSSRRRCAMAILFRSTPAATARWRPLLGALMPEHEIRCWPDIGDKARIDYALVWQPDPGLLASLPT